MLATMQANGKSAYQECQKLKAELMTRGYTFDQEGNIFEPEAKPTPQTQAAVQKEDIVK